MGTRLDDGAISAGKGAMGGVGLGEPSEHPTRQREPGPCPTKGFCYNLLEPEVGADDGVVVDERMPQQGPGRWWEVGAGIDDGARSIWMQWSARMSSLARDYFLIILIGLVGVSIILTNFPLLSLVGECSMAFWDRQDPYLGILHLVVYGPLV